MNAKPWPTVSAYDGTMQAEIRKQMKDRPVEREPLDPEEIHAGIDEAFEFKPLSAEDEAACNEVQAACRELAHFIAAKLPEGKEHTVAINNILAAALWVRHGIARRRQVALGTGAPPT